MVSVLLLALAWGPAKPPMPPVARDLIGEWTAKLETDTASVVEIMRFPTATSFVLVFQSRIKVTIKSGDTYGYIAKGEWSIAGRVVTLRNKSVIQIINGMESRMEPSTVRFTISDYTGKSFQNGKYKFVRLGLEPLPLRKGPPHAPNDARPASPTGSQVKVRE